MDGYEIDIGEPVTQLIEVRAGLRPPSEVVSAGQQYGQRFAPPYFTVRRLSDGAELLYVIEDGLPRLDERRGWRGDLPAKQLDECVAAAAETYTKWLATLYNATFNGGSTDVPTPTTAEVAAALDDYREVRPRPNNGLSWSFYENVGALCSNREPGISKVQAVVDGLPDAVSEKSARKYVRTAERLGIHCG